MSPAFRLLTTLLGVSALSAATAALACWPIRHGPLGPRLLISGLFLATGLVTALPACFTRLSATTPGR
ncbi:hypothetical protein [Kitasatospora sp. NPDC059327]|uniref:hypothetical protein n=1 Tax=Kitasatospora sp. NPDC059327 TaxID=3346803 RepID=UPI0036751327